MAKLNITCPKCGTHLTIPRMTQSRSHCDNCGIVIETQNGQLITDRRGIRIPSAAQAPSTSYTPPPRHVSPPAAGPNWGRIIGVAATVIILVGGLFYWSSQKERKAYELMAAAPTMTSANKFLRDYPSGDYFGKAVYIKDSIVFHNAVTQFEESSKDGIAQCGQLANLYAKRGSYKAEDVNPMYEDCLLKRASKANTFTDIEMYKSKFPDGQYLTNIAGFEEKLWVDLKAQYAERVKTQEVSAKAKKFVNELLDYGKRTGQKDISIRFNSVLDLKDWEDYEQKDRDLTDMLTTFSNSEGGTTYPTPSKSPPPSIKRGFSASDNTRMQSRIVSALQVRLDSVFMPNPFTVKSKTTDFDKVPNISVDYRIETLAEDYEGLTFPSLYVHTEETTYGGTGSGNYAFKGYILATGVKWDMQFKIPDSNTDYSLKTNSRPNSSFSGLRNMSRVYQLMMQSTFENYALTLANGIGL